MCTIHSVFAMLLFLTKDMSASSLGLNHLFTGTMRIGLTYSTLSTRLCFSTLPGGLDEALNVIIEMSRQQNVPFVFALGRRALGRVCAKLVPVSIVGIFCYEGSEVFYDCNLPIVADGVNCLKSLIMFARFFN